MKCDLCGLPMDDPNHDWKDGPPACPGPRMATPNHKYQLTLLDTDDIEDYKNVGPKHASTHIVPSPYIAFALMASYRPQFIGVEPGYRDWNSGELITHRDWIQQMARYMEFGENVDPQMIEHAPGVWVVTTNLNIWLLIDMDGT